MSTFYFFCFKWIINIFTFLWCIDFTELIPMNYRTGCSANLKGFQANSLPVSSQQATLGLKNRIFVFKNSGCIPRYPHTHVCLYSVMQQGHRQLALFHHYSVRTFLYSVHLFLEFLQWWLLDDTCISCIGSIWEKQINIYIFRS